METDSLESARKRPNSCSKQGCGIHLSRVRTGPRNEMSGLNERPLAAPIRKLQALSPLDDDDISAINALPVRQEPARSGMHLVRDGARVLDWCLMTATPGWSSGAIAWQPSFRNLATCTMGSRSGGLWKRCSRTFRCRNRGLSARWRRSKPGSVQRAGQPRTTTNAEPQHRCPYSRGLSWSLECRAYGSPTFFK